MLEPLRVAHVLRKLEGSAWGGTETHVAAVTRHLSDLDVSSEVHAPAGGEGRGAIDPTVPVRRFRAFNPFVGSPAARRSLWQTGGNIVSLAEPIALARDAALSLAHLHTMGRIGGAVRTAMRLTGRPYVVSVHGPLAAEAEFLREATAKNHRGTIDLGKPFGALFGARRVLDDAFRVIVFNEGERRALEPRLGERVVRMDHGVDVERFERGSRERGRARAGVAGDAPVVAMVARLCRQKNQLGAIGAFAAGAPPHARLVLAGAETDEGYAALVRAEAARLGVGERVKLLGNVAPGDVPDVLAMADLVLVPSLHEAFGLSVLEAWAARRPVLFSNVAGLVDIAANLSNASVALPAEEISAWQHAIRSMLGDASRLRAAAEEGRRVVESRYSWPRVARDLRSIYESALELPVRRVVGEFA